MTLSSGSRLLAAILAVSAHACSADSETTDSGSGTVDAVEVCATDASSSFVRPFEVDAAQYPFDSCAFETDAGTLHYVDAGPRDATHTLLMVHGNPAWSFLYRNIAPELIADGHRVVIPDHLGMGLSDIPSTADFSYRPRDHSKNLIDLVTELDLENVTLVVQDWGGPIGLNLATRNPDRIGRILIMNTWAWSVDAADPGVYHAVVDWYQEAKQSAQAIPDWFCSFVLPGQSQLTASGADPSGGEVFDAVYEAYVAPGIDPSTGNFRTNEPCAPMQLFAESIIDDDAFQGEVEGRMSALQGKPYALLFGLSDPLFGGLRCDVGTDTPCPGTSTCVCDPELLPERVPADCATSPPEFHVCKEADGSVLEPYGDRFVELLGDASLVQRQTIPWSDHFVQEDAPEQVVQALRALIDASDR